MDNSDSSSDEDMNDYLERTSVTRSQESQYSSSSSQLLPDHGSTMVRLTAQRSTRPGVANASPPAMKPTPKDLNNSTIVTFRSIRASPIKRKSNVKEEHKPAYQARRPNGKGTEWEHHHALPSPHLAPSVIDVDSLPDSIMESPHSAPKAVVPSVGKVKHSATLRAPRSTPNANHQGSRVDAHAPFVVNGPKLETETKDVGGIRAVHASKQPAAPQQQKTKKLTQKEIIQREKEQKKREQNMNAGQFIQYLPWKWPQRPDPRKSQVLAGAVILVAERMQEIRALARDKLEELYLHGADLVTSFDAETVTHIVNLKIFAQTQKYINTSLSLITGAPLDCIPLHIRILKWDWVSSCKTRRCIVQPIKAHYVHEHRWIQEYGRSPVKITRPAPKRSHQDRICSESEDEEKLARAKRARKAVEVVSDGEEGKITQYQASKNDPLAPYYNVPIGESDEDSEAERKNARYQTFSCMGRHRGHANGDINNDIISGLNSLRKVHEGRKGGDDYWKEYTLRRAIGLVRRYNKRPECMEDLLSIKGIGLKTASKIMELATTGKLKRLEYEMTEEMTIALKFQGIYGVGPQLADDWVKAGLRSLDDVAKQKGGIKLTKAQKIGLKYYDDLAERMPREEARDIYDQIQRLDPKLCLELMGSYRRGSTTCGDIDILITRNPDDGITHAGILPDLLQLLKARGIIVEDLGGESGEELEAKYMGLCRCSPDGTVRRIDILCIPFEQWGAALIYFTGDDIFNRSMRLLANKKGLSLNQRGLWADVRRDPRTRQKVFDGHIIASRTEKEIFAALGVPWQEPHERVRS